MIHRGIFYQFLYTQSAELKAQGKSPDTDTITLSELLSSADDKFRKPLTRGLGFISLDANLLDAKRIIDATEECQDVFVTQTGKPNEPVLGLLTNNRIFQHVKVE